MTFSSVSFIFFFLPIFFLLFYLLRGKGRIFCILFASLIFYSWGEIRFLPLMLGVICVNYLAAMGMARYPARKRILLAAAVVFDIGTLFFYKYFTPMMTRLFRLPEMSFFPDALPLGISFFTFQALSYAIDVYRGETAAQKNPVVFATYITMFPQLIAGPIVRYTDIEEQIQRTADGKNRIMTQDVSLGIQFFLSGLCKKVLLANILGEAWNYLSARPLENGTLGCWFGAVCYCLQIYFDFSGYSDMAIGLGKMMGFSFPRNFDHPYAAASVTEFWRRWHITLSRFFRDYLYIPLGGNRKGKGRTVLNMLAVWSLTGLWHGASLNFVLWGIYFWVFLVLERFVLRDFLDKIPAAIRRIGLFLLVTVSFVIFYFTDLGTLGVYLKSMFTFTGSWISRDAVSLVCSYGLWALAGLFAAGEAPGKLYSAVSKKMPRLCEALKIAALLAGFLLAIAALAKQSYNPFIYFRF